MNLKFYSNFNFTRLFTTALLLFICTAALTLAPSANISAQSRKAAPPAAPTQSHASPPQNQTTQAAETKPTGEAKAEQILQRAVGALGGSAYSSIRSTIGRGLFTQFKDGVSGNPVKFVDYIVYPDRERTEFGGKRVSAIQVNVGDKGWIYDGATRNLKDMAKDQVEDFRLSMRTNVDYLLRGLWRKESGAKLAYVGRREAGLAKRNETVSITYADNFVVEFEFGAKDNLPAKVVYSRKDSEGKEALEEDRFAQYISTGGILAPFITDHYKAGVQTSRINYQSLDFNAPIADSLFDKPINLKALK